jgi:Uma2 family endonuclease
MPSSRLTAESYEELSEDDCRDIEIVDGIVVHRGARSRAHQRVVHRLANSLERATDERDAVLRPEHCLLVVEVMSPGSVTADQTDKPAEYAAAGGTLTVHDPISMTIEPADLY